MPHPWKNGSGVATQSQHQRLEAEGRHAQSGHRMPLNASSWSSSDTLTVISSDARPSFKNICIGIKVHGDSGYAKTSMVVRMAATIKDFMCTLRA